MKALGDPFKVLEERSIPEPNSGCWLWLGPMFSTGYACMRTPRFPKEAKAYRISYLLHKGSIPDGLLVRHICDNPACVNPDHLILGTHKDNVQDKWRRNRGVVVVGLTEAHRSEIRETWVPRSKTCGTRALAKKYGVAPSTINLVTSGHLYASSAKQVLRENAGG